MKRKFSKKHIIFIFVIIGLILGGSIYSYASYQKSTSYISGEEIRNNVFALDNVVIASINGEAISSQEIALLNYLRNKSNTTQDRSLIYSEDIVIDIAKYKLIHQIAVNNGLGLTDAEVNEIRNDVEDSLINNDQNIDYQEGMNLTRVEYIDFITQREVNSELERRFMVWFVDSVKNKTIQANSSDFQSSLNEAYIVLDNVKNNNESTVSTDVTALIIDLYKEYINSLFDQAKFDKVS